MASIATPSSKLHKDWRRGVPRAIASFKHEQDRLVIQAQ
jgi:hypothetical protein